MDDKFGDGTVGLMLYDRFGRRGNHAVSIWLPRYPAILRQ
jgi:hypothetical protein